MPPYRIAARAFNIGGELSRRVHEPNVIAGPCDSDHRETCDDRHHGNRDYQLYSAESARVAEGRSFHNLSSAPFLNSSARLHKDGRCYMAMTMPALFTSFLLEICSPVPRDGTSGVTLGDSEWKCASYPKSNVQSPRSKVQGQGARSTAVGQTSPRFGLD